MTAVTEPRSTSYTWTRAVVILLGLTALLYANYYLRNTLEDAPRRMYSFMEYFYAPQIPVVFAKPWWELLLPIKEFTGAWVTTTLILTYLVERAITPAGAWLLYNAVAIVVAFATSWVILRSAIFSFTFAICVGFGTQFYHAYAVAGGIASYLVLTYHVLLLGAMVQVVAGARPRAVWVVAFLVSLALNALGYEGWLDLLVAIWLATPLVYVALRKMDRVAEARRLLAISAVSTAAGIAYVLVKVNMGFGQTEGSESDVVFNYPSLLPVVDDLISNLFTHTYLAVSNFLPPALVGPSAFYRLGAEALVDGQHSYHSDFAYLVIMNQVFFWRYYAGAVFVVLLFAAFAAWRQCWRHPSAWSIAPGVFLLMILAAGPTHTLVKFRPMKSMPVMTYHVTIGVIGVSLLLAWLLVSAWRRWNGGWRAVLLTAAVWLVILYGALARPAYLAHMSAQAGLGEFLYPNPMGALMKQLGYEYETPRGLAMYRLKPLPTNDSFADVRELLTPLPGALPPLDQWQLTAADPVKSLAGGSLGVIGDDTQYGYQLMSPPLPVKPGTRHLVRLRFEVIEGRVCGGVLSGDQQRWLVPADGTTAEYVFDSADVDSVRIVFANCYRSEGRNPRTRLRVFGGSYAALDAPAVTR